MISLWKKDNTVQSLPLPHPVFLQLVDMLIYNTKSLPMTQRILNGFYVSIYFFPPLKFIVHKFEVLVLVQCNSYHCFLKVIGYPYRGSNSHFDFFASLFRGVNSKRKEFALLEANSFFQG